MLGEQFVPRLATPDDSDEVARLLDDFNNEFDTPTPGVEFLARRLRDLLSRESTFAIVAGSPAVAFALVTLRPNVWYDGPVALLDELYVVPPLRGSGIGSGVIEFLAKQVESRGVDLVEINVDESDVNAQRFYERHGYSGVEETTGERAFYYSREF